MDLIDVLLKDKLISHRQVEDARQKQAGAKKPLSELLIEMGFIAGRIDQGRLPGIQYAGN
jgi:hypothetical protein